MSESAMRADVSHVWASRTGGWLVSCVLHGGVVVLAMQAAMDIKPHLHRRHFDGTSCIVKPMFYARTYFVCMEEGRVNEHERDHSTPLDLDMIPLTNGMNLATGRVTHVPGGEIVVKAFFKG